MSLRFRPCSSEDWAATRALVDAAFLPEDVVTFLDALRADGCLLGEWLAEEAGGPIAHIAFSRVFLEAPGGLRRPAAMLTPLSVRPDRQRKGVGGALMAHALRALEAKGETLFFVLGHPEYYPRAGFRSAPDDAVASPWPQNPAFMMRGAAAAGRLILPAAIADAH